MHRCEPRAERDLRGGAVDAADVRVRNEGDCPCAGNERAERVQRSRINSYARGGENDVVDVVDVCIGDLVVEFATALVERAELRLVARERAAAVGAALPCRVGVDLEHDGERAVAEVMAQRRRLHGPAAECDHGRVG